MAQDYSLKIKVDANAVDKASNKLKNMGNVIKGATRPDPVADMTTYIGKLGASAQTTAGKIQTISGLAASFGGPWGVAIAGVATAIATCADKFDLFGEKAEEARKEAIAQMAKMSSEIEAMQLEDMVYGTHTAEIKQLKDQINERNKQYLALENKKQEAIKKQGDLYYINERTGRRELNVLMVREEMQDATLKGAKAEAAARQLMAKYVQEALDAERDQKALEQGTLQIIRQRKALEEKGKETKEEKKKVDIQPRFGSLDYIDKQIAEKSKEYKATTDPKKRLQLQGEIVNLQFSRDIMSNGASSKMLKSLPMTSVVKNPLTNATLKNVGTSAETPQADWMETYQSAAQGLTNTLVVLASTMSEVNSAYDRRIATLQSGAVLTKTEAREVENLTKKQAQLTKIQSILNVTTQSLAASESVLALIGAIKTATTSSKHWIEAIAAVASVTGAVVGAIATAKSYKTYAVGGIVGGNNRIGDMQTVRVNAGEMILNGKQQKQLFNMINQGRQASQAQNVSFRIEGRDLVGAIDNYNRYI